jgi:hypothetical protein
MLGTNGVMPQTNGLGPGTLERTLRVATQRVRIDTRRRMRREWLSQSGLASSINMIGIPSSTGKTRRQE